MFETKTNIKLHDTDAAGITFFANHYRIAHTAYEALSISGLDAVCDTCGKADLTGDGEVDMDDLLEFTDNWLWEE